jgi:hypothetical protein
MFCMKVHDVLDAGQPSGVEDRLALRQHVDAVAGQQKQSVDSGECRVERLVSRQRQPLGPVEIEEDRLGAQPPQEVRGLLPAGRSSQFWPVGPGSARSSRTRAVPIPPVAPTMRTLGRSSLMTSGDSLGMDCAR